ncbi:hypothetical protein V6N13_040186 [Hibiscus sabdariffa]
MASARYAMVSTKSRWEEQGFHFDDSLPNYGLEQFVYNRLNELGWFRFARQPARANYNWVLEFYANNAAGEDFSMLNTNAHRDLHHQSSQSPATPPSPPAPAQTEEAAPPLQYMMLRSQLQRIEARQLHFQEEFKVFQSNLIKFLNFQFPASAAFFGQTSTPPSQPSASAAAAAQPSTNTSAKEGATEEVHFSSDDENDIFDWQSPRDHLLTLGPVTPTPTPAAPILSAAPTPNTSAVAERPTPDSPARKRGKATAGRTIGRNDPSSPEVEADQRPAKRRRRYHIITADSDDDDSSAELPVPKPMKSADHSLSPSI